jgi:hypothetical protein
MTHRTSRRAGLASAAVAGLTGALAFTGLAPAAAAPGGTPDFGPNVTIFSPGTPLEEINSRLQAISAEPEFGTNRHAVYFLPGTYGSAAGEHDPSTATGIVNAQVGYYTSIQGLGTAPDDVVINGALHVEPEQHPFLGPSSLRNFWRSLGNLSVNPIQRPVGADAAKPNPEGVEDPHTMRWAVSQAAPLRRVEIQGDLDLTGRYGAYAFGSYLANSRVEGAVISGDGTVEKAQAHWYTRDSEIGGWDGGAVNMVFSGVDGAPAGDFDPGDKTTLPTTPLVREAPFLVADGGRYAVHVPSAKRNTSGTSWSTGPSDGTTIPVDRFSIAKPSDSAATINASLAAGKHLILTPGVYRLDEPIRVTRPDTVVMGLGYATLVPQRGTAAVEIGDVPGVVLSSVIVDAGPVRSDVLVRVGTRAGHVGRATDPTTLSDVFVRVGGPAQGSAGTSVEVNSDHVLLDHTWLWRGDHGSGIGWSTNVAERGLVVNGDDVTALGLFVEHYQQEQVLWNGERGRTIFYQSETPKDVPTQSAWVDGDKEGYAAYEVGDGVRTHEATGLAVYSLFENPTSQAIHAWTAIAAPRSPAVRFRSMATGVVLGVGGIRHVVNDAGAPVDATQPDGEIYRMIALSRLASYPAR